MALIVDVQLAANLGYGISWLVQTLTVAIILTTGFFIYVVLSTRSRHATRGGFDNLKYQIYKYHAERYWGVFVAAMLIWLWYLGYSWAPPVAFSDAIQKNQNEIHTVKVTAGQWFWQLEDGGYGSGPAYSQAVPPSESKTSAPAGSGSSRGGMQELHIKAGETVKFIARSQDVNHGFAILSSNKSMDAPILQMQVVPGFDSVFYYTFDKPGNYTIRCLEYCGWNHPFMTSQLRVYAS